MEYQFDRRLTVLRPSGSPIMCVGAEAARLAFGDAFTINDGTPVFEIKPGKVLRVRTENGRVLISEGDLKNG